MADYEKKDHINELKNKFIEQFENFAENGEFLKGWKMSSGGMPRNAFTKNPYHGINVFVLGMAGFDSSDWASFNQVKNYNKENGTDIKIRKGEQGQAIYAYVLKNILSKDELKKIETDKENGKISRDEYDVKLGEGKIPVLAYSTHLFNTSQMDNFPVQEMEKKKTEFEEVAELELIAKAMSEARDVKLIFHHEDKAFFDSKEKAIYMPHKEYFRTPADFYRTLMHENVHATGHADMLDRDTLKNYFLDIQTRAKEEMVAELGSFLAGKMFGVSYNGQTDINHREYVRSWVSALKAEDGKKELIRAFSKASKAVEYIDSVKKEYVLLQEKRLEKSNQLEKILDAHKFHKINDGMKKSHSISM